MAGQAVMSKRVTNMRWSGGFRETFLVVFTRKGDAAALRRLACLLTELYRSAAPRWWPAHKRGDVDAILCAVVADLRHLRYVLEWAAGGVTYSALGMAYNQLARDCSGEVEEIAAAIEAAMADPKGTAERHRASLMPREVAS
jgi:hypothetical protein